MQEKVPYTGRRINSRSFFEPIYDPSLSGSLGDNDFSISNWNFENNRGPRRFILNGEDLTKNSKYAKVSGVTFTECDFLGEFEGIAITFDKCTFQKCEFRGSFKNVKFSSCTFRKCSLSLIKLQNCQFRRCNYEEIGISGNETQIIQTDITDPEKFLSAASTNISHLPDGVTREYQLLRLCQTQAALARVILQNQSIEGTDESYYSAVKAATLYANKSRRAMAKLLLPNFSSQENRSDYSIYRLVMTYTKFAVIAFSSYAEYAILWTAGALNAWGRSIFRVLCAGVVLIVGLCALRTYALSLDFLQAMLPSIEVFLLFGYTKHSFATDPQISSFVNLATASCGLAWYAITAATVVNKVTRVRG